MSVSRRRLLAAAGSAAAVAGLAGCNDQEVQRQEFESEPVHVGEEGLRVMGYGSGSHQPLETERSRTVAGQTVEVAITNHATTYAVGTEADEGTADGAARRLPLGLLSTPSAEVLGHQLNPLLGLPPEQLLASDRGRRALATVTSLDGDFEWVVGPEEQEGAGETTMFGSSVTVRPYTGVVEGSNRREAVVVYLGRGARESDAVVVAAAKRVPVADGFEGPVIVDSRPGSDARGEDTDASAGGADDRSWRRGTTFAFYTDEIVGRQYDLLLEVVDDVAVGVPALNVSPPPDVVPADLRLVQAVEDTRVTTSPTTDADDPDMVVGDNTAAVFEPEVGGSGSMSKRLDKLPAWYFVEIDIVRKNTTSTETTYLGKDDLELFVNGSDDHRKVWTQLSRDTASTDNAHRDDLPVFQLPRDVQSVTVSFRTPSYAELGKRTVRAGSDFEVSETGPLKVGFIMIKGPDGGDNYGARGTGAPRRYYPHVENTVDYLRSAYPGPISAYRSGRWLIGGKTRKVTIKGTFLGKKNAEWDGDVVDHRNAMKTMERIKSKSRFFTDGDLYTQGISPSDAKNEIRDDGFDAVVLVTSGTDPSNTDAVPSSGSVFGSYYDYHDQNTSGGRTLGRKYGDHRLAVGGLDYGDPWQDGVEAASTTAQELGHYFVDVPYRGVGGSNHPFGQRDSDGKDVTVGGTDVDLDHARELSTGVVSVGYDLADGTFGVVQEPDTNNTNAWNSSGEVVQSDFTSSDSLETYESYMSYSDADTWTDAIVHQALIGTTYNWKCSYTNATCNSRVSAEREDGDRSGPERRELLDAVGVVRDDGSVALVDFELRDGVRRQPEAGDAVAVELQAGPGGETLSTETHPGRIGATHMHGAADAQSRMVLVELPFEVGATHLAVRGEGERSGENVVSGVVAAGLERLDDEAIPGAEVEERLVELLNELETLVDERAYDEALVRLGDIREVVDSELRQIDPVETVEPYGEMVDAAATTRDDVLDQVDRLRAHLEGMV